MRPLRLPTTQTSCASTRRRWRGHPLRLRRSCLQPQPVPPAVRGVAAGAAHHVGDGRPRVWCANCSASGCAIIGVAAGRAVDAREAGGTGVRRSASALRRDSAAGRPGLAGGPRDAPIGRALALLHEDPERGMDRGRLAREVALSRSLLGQRFVALVGESPMQYLGVGGWPWRHAPCAPAATRSRAWPSAAATRPRPPSAAPSSASSACRHRPGARRLSGRTTAAASRRHVDRRRAAAHLTTEARLSSPAR